MLCKVSWSKFTLYISVYVFIIYTYSGRMSPTDTKSEKSSLTMLTGFSAGTRGIIIIIYIYK